MVVTAVVMLAIAAVMDVGDGGGYGGDFDSDDVFFCGDDVDGNGGALLVVMAFTMIVTI